MAASHENQNPGECFLERRDNAGTYKTHNRLEHGEKDGKRAKHSFGEQFLLLSAHQACIFIPINLLFCCPPRRKPCGTAFFIPEI